MPTYQYQCDKGHSFELLQKISEKPKRKCPTCGAKASRIISGGAGLIFKGSGFYITDYGKDGKGPRKAEGSDAPPPAAEPKSGEGKAAKSESAAPATPKTDTAKPKSSGSKD